VGHLVHHSHDGARDLRDPVLHRGPQGDPPGDQHARRHRRVHLAAGDRPDRVGDGQQDEPEGRRDAERADVLAGQYGGADGEEDQQERAEELTDDVALVHRTAVRQTVHRTLLGMINPCPCMVGLPGE
jgi:hypothetical protein